MAYAKFDDRYDDHRKIKRALRREPAAVAIHAMAITYCNRHETDGLIDAMQVEDWIAVLPYKPAQRTRVLDTLLNLRLLDRVDDEHYAVHDFLDWNDSRAQRERLRDAGRRGALARWAKGGPDSPPNADRNADRNGVAIETPNGPPHHTTPTPISSGEPADEKRWPDEVVRLVELHSQLIRERFEVDPSSRRYRPTRAWFEAMDRLIRLDKRTPRQIEWLMRWIRHDPFWGGNVQSTPTLREKFDQIADKAKRQAARADNVHQLHPQLTAAELMAAEREGRIS